ncbi:hypothetical protein ACIBEJ_51495 [Nonomuraea sp. NPDC050790]|uniref:hypothetical protein n=1 Tax=Nonomuraea sp. NPDC050790 TaxID=3364371 RepID=UPI0037A1A239
MRDIIRISVTVVALVSGLALPVAAQAADSNSLSHMVCTYRITAQHHFVISNGDRAFLVRAGQQFAGYRHLTAIINGVPHRQMEPGGLAWGQVRKMVEIPASCRV